MNLTKEQRKELVDDLVWSCLCDNDFFECRINELVQLNNNGVLPDWYSPDWVGYIWSCKKNFCEHTQKVENLLKRHMKLLVKFNGDGLHVLMEIKKDCAKRLRKNAELPQWMRNRAKNTLSE